MASHQLYCDSQLLSLWLCQSGCVCMKSCGWSVYISERMGLVGEEGWRWTVEWEEGRIQHWIETLASVCCSVWGGRTSICAGMQLQYSTYKEMCVIYAICIVYIRMAPWPNAVSSFSFFAEQPVSLSLTYILTNRHGHITHTQSSLYLLSALYKPIVRF